MDTKVPDGKLNAGNGSAAAVVVCRAITDQPHLWVLLCPGLKLIARGIIHLNGMYY